MKRLYTAAALSVICCLLFTATAFAKDKESLFINMTSDDAHRSEMAIGFGKGQLERGHPLTIFLNDKGVLVASTANSAKHTVAQNMLASLIEKGASIIVCQTCMAHYGVKQDALIKGAQLSTPELSGQALFKENSRSLSW